VCLRAGDTLGNVALLDIHGKEIWEKHVKSMLGQVRTLFAWFGCYQTLDAGACRRSFCLLTAPSHMCCLKTSSARHQMQLAAALTAIAPLHLTQSAVFGLCRAGCCGW
jgi:hypothetical protein